MPKGYVIARVSVTDPAAYGEYAKGATDAIRLYGGRVLVRGGRHEAVEGEARARNVVIEFESFDRALAYFRSPEYQAARRHRENAGVGEFVVAEGAE